MYDHDDDWGCPLYHRDNGRMLPCPLGGCSLRDGCARQKAEDLTRLTGTTVTPEQCKTR